MGGVAPCGRPSPYHGWSGPLRASASPPLLACFTIQDDSCIGGIASSCKNSENISKNLAYLKAKSW